MFKRIFDISLALIGIVLTLPIMALSAFLIRMDSEGYPLFKQERVGKNGKVFHILKLRTMVEDAESIGPQITAHSDPRITQVGALLRWLKFDELPQLFNVLKGDMSIVGPRPEVLKIVEIYDEKYKKILTVRPGIFGPNQIENRDEAAQLTEKDDVEQFYIEKILPYKLKRDLAYVNKKNPFKDIELLFTGIATVISSSIKLRYILESRRRILFLLFDITVSIFCYWFAFLLRFEGKIPVIEADYLKLIIPLIIVVRTPCFIYFGLYQTLWQYLGIRELFSIIRAATLGSIIIPIYPYLTRSQFFPRSVFIMDWIILITALGGSRVVFKLITERLRSPGKRDRKNVLIVGAEDQGELLVREFIKRPELGYCPIGFVDDDPMKQNVRIHGVKVMGKTSQIPQVARVRKVNEVIIALSEASGDEIREIIQTCRALNLPTQIVPNTSALMTPQALPLQLRPVNVSDLLGRELVQADLASIQAFIQDKRVLVTGAGGSIGSELARVIFQNRPRELILIDNAESSLYDIEMDLKATPGNTDLYYYLRDICNRSELEKIIARHKPQIIYHAAAYKHVPLMEGNSQIGITNNVLGTKNIADLALKYGVEKFVLISTDKAINPTSIMGATKRIAELYTQSLNGSDTYYMAVRFGNVFNSKGSVVPLFQKQIERGGPITITDENVTRYFMDISEAVFLILQASILGKGSEIFILDMGKPVRIVDLAKNLVKLMGLSPNSIPIKYTGLRPGEKLEEEIQLEQEDAIQTNHSKIKIWKSKFALPDKIQAEVEALLELSSRGVPREELIETLKKMIPEYRPWHYPN